MITKILISIALLGLLGVGLLLLTGHAGFAGRIVIYPFIFLSLGVIHGSTFQEK